MNTWEGHISYCWHEKKSLAWITEHRCPFWDPPSAFFYLLPLYKKTAIMLSWWPHWWYPEVAGFQGIIQWVLTRLLMFRWGHSFARNKSRGTPNPTFLYLAMLSHRTTKPFGRTSYGSNHGSSGLQLVPDNEYWDTLGMEHPLYIDAQGISTRGK